MLLGIILDVCDCSVKIMYLHSHYDPSKRAIVVHTFLILDYLIEDKAHFKN